MNNSIMRELKKNKVGKQSKVDSAKRNWQRQPSETRKNE